MKEKSSIFREKMLKIVRAIPRGKTLSYGRVAQKAGFPGAARAVGSVMKANLDPEIPCHRVVKSDGSPGQYNRPGGTKTKVMRLEKEGVKIG